MSLRSTNRKWWGEDGKRDGGCNRSEDSTGTLCGDGHAALEVELEVVVALQPEIVVVVVSGRQVHEDRRAVLLPQVTRQVPPQEVEGSARSRQARVEHLCPTPAAPPPDGPAGVVQVLIPGRREAELAGDHHAGATEALDSLRHEGSPVLTAATWQGTRAEAQMVTRLKVVKSRKRKMISRCSKSSATLK